MKIIVDAFGGDNAPLEIIKGCEMAVGEYGTEIVLTGNQSKIAACAKENNISLSNMTIIDAPDVMSMEDNPKEILKSKSETSMAIGLKKLAEGMGDAFVSAGSTGALVVGSTFLVKRIHGIKRAAIATLLPSDNGPFMLIDSGANVECRAEALSQFAMMGNIYMNKIIGVEKPKVGLVNVGTEDTKGGELQHEAFALMKEADYNFTGNIEARDIPYGICDVVVCDGFTGNVILKLYEGVAGMLLSNIKAIFKKNKLTMLSALMLKSGLMDFKKKMDYTEQGGAPLMGISKPVIKAHGSSNAKAIKNAIHQACEFKRTDVIAEIEKQIGEKDENVE